MYTTAPLGKLRDKFCDSVSNFLLRRVATEEYRTYVTALLNLGAIELERAMADKIAATPKPENTPIRKTGKATPPPE